jgi:hypothetical protein
VRRGLRRAELSPAAEPTRPLSTWRTAYPVPSADDGDQTRLSPAPTRLLFVCQSHAVLSPMAEGLARHAYRRLNIYVHSAGLQRGGAKTSAVTALSEIGIGLDREVVTGVQDVELGSFDLLVALGIPRLGHHMQQMTLCWDDPVLLEIDARSPMRRVRLARDGLLQRIRALGAILSTTNRA